MVPGTIVRIHSLSGMSARLNNLHGALVEYNEQRGRWDVKICAEGINKTVSLDPADSLKFVRAPYRFALDAVVYCSRGQGLVWEKGRIVQLHYEEPENVFHPYQIRLDNGGLIFAPLDRDACIRTFDREPLTAEELDFLRILDQHVDAHRWKAVSLLREKTLQIAQKVRGFWPDLAGDCFRWLGCGFAGVGMYQTAMELHSRHLDLCVEVNDRAGEGVACGNIASCLSSLGRHNTAIEMLEKSYLIARENGDRDEEAQCLGDLGSDFNSMGKHKQAAWYFEQQLEIVRETGDSRQQANALGHLSNVYLSLGRYQKAIEFGKESLEVCEEVQCDDLLFLGYSCLGDAYQVIGEHETAIKYFTQCVDLHRELGSSRVDEGISLGRLGEIHLEKKDTDKGLELLEQALAIARDLEEKGMESDWLLSHGTAKHSLALSASSMKLRDLRLGEAMEDFRACVAVAAQTGKTETLCKGLCGLARSHICGLGGREHHEQAQGAGSWAASADEAEQCLDRVMTLVQSEGGLADCTHLRGHTCLLRVLLACSRGHDDDALEQLQQHLSLVVGEKRSLCHHCGQVRGQDAPMITCSDCGVARFCNTTHQEMACRAELLFGLSHADVCPLFSKWRRVVKGDISRDECRQDLVDFLKRVGKMQSPLQEGE